jgi:hypothetical protein
MHVTYSINTDEYQPLSVKRLGLFRNASHTETPMFVELCEVEYPLPEAPSTSTLFYPGMDRRRISTWNQRSHRTVYQSPKRRHQDYNVKTRTEYPHQEVGRSSMIEIKNFEVPCDFCDKVVQQEGYSEHAVREVLIKKGWALEERVSYDCGLTGYARKYVLFKCPGCVKKLDNQ